MTRTDKAGSRHWTAVPPFLLSRKAKKINVARQGQPNHLNIQPHGQYHDLKTQRIGSDNTYGLQIGLIAVFARVFDAILTSRQAIENCSVCMGCLWEITFSKI